VLNGVVGAAGLRATMATLQAGATLALANKESMVAGGPFVLDAARRSGSPILPVDSEHSALFQCIAAGGSVGDGDKAGADVVSAGPPRALEELLKFTRSGEIRDPGLQWLSDGSRIWEDELRAEMRHDH
jgi:hypothetical protein